MALSRRDRHRRRLAQLAAHVTAAAEPEPSLLPRIEQSDSFTHLGRPLPLSAVGEMRESTELLGRADSGRALRERLDADGYLLLRGVLGRPAVEAAKAQLVARLAEENGSQNDVMTAASVPLVHDVLRRGPMIEVFETLLGGAVKPLDYTWLRRKVPGPEPDASSPHCDSIFMDRGSKDLVTAWTPFTDVSLEMGGLMILENSYTQARYGDADEPLAEYARIDIDAHCESHAASREVVEQANAESRGLRMDELELIRAGRAARLAFPDNLPDPVGGGSGALENAHTMAEQNVAGRWLTAEYRMGDVLLFSIYTMHGSTDNNSTHERISTDTRYQLASEPFDARWMGPDAKLNLNPHSCKNHSGFLDFAVHLANSGKCHYCRRCFGTESERCALLTPNEATFDTALRVEI